MSTTLLKNCRLYNESSNEKLFDIIIKDSLIDSILEKGERNDADTVVDIKGRILAPGLIDVHIQGAGGADILDNNLESLQTISKTLAKVGTTGFLGTTVVKPTMNNEHLKLAAKYVHKDLGGAELLGFHLEGPFINIRKKGGLAEDGIYSPSVEAMNEILEVTGNHLSMMTIAPELPGNTRVIKLLVDNNVVAAFAHSNATYEELKKGFTAGINHVTHIFNAMPPLHHRTPGPLAAIFEHPSVSAQIISDGHHLHPSIVNMLYKLLGPERCICITDGMHGIGLPDGKYIYNGREYESKEGAARYLDGTLIGSTTSLANIALKFMEFTGCSMKEAINTVTINPARLLQIDDRKGTIEKGKDADIVVFDFDYSIFATFVNGKNVFLKT